MVKYLLAFIVILYNCIACAQNVFPAGAANTYTLGEKDGYPGFNYYYSLKDSLGFSYTVDYNNNFCITGNNFSTCTDTLRKKQGGIYYIKILEHNKTLLIGPKAVYFFQNTKLIKEITLPNELNACFSISGVQKFILFSNVKDSVMYSILEYGKISPQYNTGFAMSYEKTQNHNMSFAESVSGDIYAMKKNKDGGSLYRLNSVSYQLEFIKKYIAPGPLSLALIKDQNDCFVYTGVGSIRQYFSLTDGILIPIKNITLNNTENSKTNLLLRLAPISNQNSVLIKQELGKYYIGSIKKGSVIKDVPFIYPEDFVNYTQQSDSISIWGSAGNKPFRIFPYIKKYPAIFNRTNSASIFSLQEDVYGNIWAGSYQGNLAVIDNELVKNISSNGIMYMNGGSIINNNMYFIGEGQVGLFRYAKNGRLIKNLSSFTTGYYTYISKDKKYFYYGTPAYNGLWQTTTESLQNNLPVWKKIDSTRGSYVHNILTITEDTLGRIWYGHGRRSLAVYFPDKDSAKTWTTETGETQFGAFASLVDHHGTLWIGSSLNGLWYYDDYTKPANPSSFKKVNHPLLNSNNPITALTRFENWLVIANYDKILLLQTDSLFFTNQTIVRYLNPQEANFNSFTEQNTMLTAKKDSSIWFSTSDMLYRWDIKRWLRLPWKPAILFPVLQYRNQTDTLLTNKTIFYKPGENTFAINLLFVSPDNLPRYLSAALIKRGEKIVLPAPSLNTGFSYQNLGPGKYDFFVEVYEMNGSVTKLQFTIVIKQFLWQQWWFWLTIALLTILIISYLLQLKKKKQLAEEKAKSKELELINLKAEQDKKIATLQLVALSNQFRPHFILNALNTIGAQMDDKPDAESVLSRLGESVNLIFNHVQQHKILYPFENEWSLVKNVIHIHTSMYLKKLEVEWPDLSTIEHINSIEVPLGILQIPVENALLHGLSNKETGPWKLSIAITEKGGFIKISITDNGVGRKKSAMLSNFTKHGTGTNNQLEIINIINTVNNEKISIVYKDGVFTNGNDAYGTTVWIEIPKQLNYEIK